MSSAKISQRIQPGLWRVHRVDCGSVVWMAMANGITYVSHSEDQVRLWLSKEMDDPQPLPAA